MKVLITGGHFSPALAVIEAIRSKASVLVVGRKHALEGDSGLSFEYEVARKRNIPFKELSTARIQRMFSWYTLFSILKFPVGLLQAFFIVKKYKPDIVLTFGGYIAVPIAITSFFLGIPVVVHEQTQKGGLANRLLSIFAKKVCISFLTSQPFFPKEKVVHTGIPIRNEVFYVQRTLSVPELPVIYVTGGGTGSHFINEKIRHILPKLVEHYVVIHQVGDSQLYGDYERLTLESSKLSPELKERYVLRKFIFPDEIGWIMRNSDVVVSRSGINIVSELIVLKKPCLLIPFPSGQENEQLENATLAQKIGIAHVLPQEEVTNEKLYEEIKKLLEKRMPKMRNEIAKEYKFIHAAEKIVDVLHVVYEQNSQKKS